MRALCCTTLSPLVCIKGLFNEHTIKERVLSPTQRKKPARLNREILEKRGGGLGASLHFGAAEGSLVGTKPL